MQIQITHHLTSNAGATYSRNLPQNAGLHSILTTNANANYSRGLTSNADAATHMVSLEMPSTHDLAQNATSHAT